MRTAYGNISKALWVGRAFSHSTPLGLLTGDGRSLKLDVTVHIKNIHLNRLCDLSRIPEISAVNFCSFAEDAMDNLIAGRWLFFLAGLTGLMAPMALAQSSTQPDQIRSFPVHVDINLAKTKGPLKPIYRFFGADEPNFAYMKDGMKLLGDIGQLGDGQPYFRAHNILTTGDGTPAFKWGSTNIYTEDANGNPVYDWTIVDRIFDAYLSHGVKPYVEIGFTPKAMSTHPDPYQHNWAVGKNNTLFTGWAYPPKDYNKWRELIFQWAKHCVDKYGKSEVEQWYWEVWNESNIGYWKGTPQEFYKLHDYAIDGVRRALPTARVGGPDCAGSGGQWMRDFLEHCLSGTNFATGQVGTPIDFVSFHAKGQPRFVNDHVEMGISNQLRDIDTGFALFAQYPQLKSKPIVIGESDPDTAAAGLGPQLGYRSTTMYSSYTAATFGREQEMAERRGVNLEGATTWAFEFENQPIFAGYRVMATNGGINVPAFNVFRMFGKMKGQRLDVQSSGAVSLDDIIRSGVRGQADVNALAAVDGNKLYVLMWHYHDDDVNGPDATTTISLTGLANAAQGQLTEYRVDQDHSNAHTVWQKMGSPQNPTPEQYQELLKAGQLEMLDGQKVVTIENGTAQLSITLPRHAVSLLVMSW
jgi:xylan 1,4-beta-xylosidase